MCSFYRQLWCLNAEYCKHIFVSNHRLKTLILDWYNNIYKLVVEMNWLCCWCCTRQAEDDTFNLLEDFYYIPDSLDSSQIFLRINICPVFRAILSDILHQESSYLIKIKKGKFDESIKKDSFSFKWTDQYFGYVIINTHFCVHLWRSSVAHDNRLRYHRFTCRGSFTLWLESRVGPVMLTNNKCCEITPPCTIPAQITPAFDGDWGDNVPCDFTCPRDYDYWSS